jgi:hypothetical protein
MTKKVALVTGVGPGTGSAIVRRFAEGHYEVAMIARRRGSLMRGGVDRCRPVYPPPAVYTLGLHPGTGPGEEVIGPPDRGKRNNRYCARCRFGRPG